MPDGCPVRVVEYKCPWKHRDLHPNQAFLTPGICGIQNGNNVVLKSTSNYYSQVQLQLFVSGLAMCTFVVWTNKGIFIVEVLCDPGFISVVCTKLEKFWTSQILLFLISVASMTSLPNSSHEAFCSSQDSSISEQYISSSAQQPCSHPKEDVVNNS